MRPTSEEYKQYCDKCLAQLALERVRRARILNPKPTKPVSNVCKEDGCTEQTVLRGSKRARPKRCVKCTKARAAASRVKVNEKKKEGTYGSADGTLTGCVKCVSRRLVEGQKNKNTGSEGQSTSDTQTVLGISGFGTAQKEEMDEEEDEEIE
ncbi:hypothetical protein LTR56_027573 [Elasticomyces elasticus]|nr:hypothetical protein LTR56_027573 [Elasticomyces elasticus]KAK3614939.1 hypothetical protein LTR22_027620 [Elasticomyces elasticus]KAK4896005.1 hypothetical protein LTR49_028192 [Elasticomyces elasticus]KAK5734115.1 hypothetical protein LTS12_026786 [Elasticomyces elasticus]